MNKWTKRRLDRAKETGSWSKDPSSQVGAYIVGERGQGIAEGYNGFPRGIADTPERLNDRLTKYRYVVHAEKNAIYNAGWNGASTYGASMYVDGMPPCGECAKGIIQTGIKRVYVRHKRDVSEVWQLRWEEARDMFDEVGVYYERYFDDGTLIESGGGRDEPVLVPAGGHPQEEPHLG